MKNDSERARAKALALLFCVNKKKIFANFPITIDTYRKGKYTKIITQTTKKQRDFPGFRGVHVKLDGGYENVL